MPELIQTLKSMKKKEMEERKFTAGLKGIDLNIDEGEESQGKTFEDIERKALGITASSDDVVGLQGAFADRAGFGIDMGLGYERI